MLYSRRLFVPSWPRAGEEMRDHRLEGRMRRPESSAYSDLLRTIRKLSAGRKNGKREKTQTGLTGMSRTRRQGYPNQCGWSIMVLDTQSK